MTRNPICVRKDEKVILAGRRMRNNHVKSLVVIDENEDYCGLITTRMIADRYISSTDKLGPDGSNVLRVAQDLVASLEENVETLMETNVLKVDGEDLLKDAATELMQNELREAIVMDAENPKKVIGIITRTDVARQLHKNVILLDHNDSVLAPIGIEEANILEILDHHRLGDLSTTKPIKVLNIPVGSTATIVAQQFEEYEYLGIKMPRSIAAILLSAIMTDTVILNSPTTTQLDKKVAKMLADKVGVKIEKFGYEVFEHKASVKDMSVKELLGRDCKEFEVGDDKVLIAQYETIDPKVVLKREDDIRKHMKKLRDNGGYLFVLFMITDIIKQGSVFVAVGDIKLLNRIFDIQCKGQGGTWIPGIVSRKLQVAPKILSA